MDTFVIAEAGSNHNKDFDTALALIDAAVNARCSAVKFQTFKAERLFTRFVPDFANYSDIYGLIKSIELPRSWQQALFDYCKEKNIEFMSTPFDEEAIEQLCNLGVKRMKIAGFEAQDPRFIKKVAATKLPIIISLGIGIGSKNPALLCDSIKQILDWIYSENDEADITLLHCNNAYPTPYEDINLSTITIIKRLLISLGLSKMIKVGLSDHTVGILIPPIAVGMGAQCVEKHFTLSRDMIGPDHHFAIDPYELYQMVNHIKIVEQAAKFKDNIYTPSEMEFAVGTRVVVANKPITKGETLNLDNITTKRGKIHDAVPAIDYYKIVDNYVTLEDILEDGVIKWKTIAKKQQT